MDRTTLIASRPIDHMVLHTMTELDVECIHQATASVDIDNTLLHKPTAAGFSTYVYDVIVTPQSTMGYTSVASVFR